MFSRLADTSCSPILSKLRCPIYAVPGNHDPRGQEAHELIRRHSQEAARVVKAEGKPNDLLERLRGESLFDGVDFEALVDPDDRIGLAPTQVDRFVTTVVQPIRERYQECS